MFLRNNKKAIVANCCYAISPEGSPLRESEGRKAIVPKDRGKQRKQQEHKTRGIRGSEGQPLEPQEGCAEGQPLKAGLMERFL